MTLHKLIQKLKTTRDLIDEWIKTLEETDQTDLRRFYKKGIKAPGTRVRALLKDVRDEANLIRKDILRHRKEMDLFKDTESFKGYRKSKRKANG